jgi:hypothetical protein
MSVKASSAMALPKWVCAAALALASVTSASATPVVYDFESFGDSEQVTNQLAGLSFGQTTALQAGISLNEFDFPPHSGTTVVFDNGGAITIDFSSPVFSVGAFFSYASSLTLAVFDSSDNLLFSTASLFGNNLATSGEVGSSPNEFISLTDAIGRITRLTITGDLSGGSFTMDDLTVDAGRALPEPSTAALLVGLLGLGALPGGWMRRQRR